MTDRESKLVLAGLLHDIGKVVFRKEGYAGGHSQNGYAFLADELKIEDSDILECVRYHHPECISSAGLADDSLAYIVAMANGIASAVDRKGERLKDGPFAKSMPLQSIFNRLNMNQGKMYYRPETLNGKGTINYPVEEKEELGQAFYEGIKDNITRELRNLEKKQGSILLLLEVLEENLSYVPAVADKGMETDISLFDHLKLTAAVSECILKYLDEKGIRNYREGLFGCEEDFYGEETFLLFSMDISGIQAFIYTIASENALKTLRARSFYLEIMMEHIIDCLLQETGLSRANLIYSGGGHCYILMPNSEQTMSAVDRYMDGLNHWLLEAFDISLYVAWGYAPCSANGLSNLPEGSYGKIFRQISEEIGNRKSRRYSARDIQMLNSRKYSDYTRECKVCKKLSGVDEEGICPLCRAIQRFSANILYDEVFIIRRGRKEDALPLPGEYWLSAGGREELERAELDPSFARAYSKNKRIKNAAKLWVGDYTAGKTFAEYAGEAEGIERIAVIRADVDNLGQAFVSGFENPGNQNRYVTLSRTAALSRQLSLFFKLHINQLLAESHYSIDGKDAHSRNVMICYSGGDDLFIVGAWNEIVEMAVDIRRAFERYAQGALTFSAGIGVYADSYPISAIAGEVAEMEDASKALPKKNAVTIFPDGQSHMAEGADGTELSVQDGTYGWEEFEQCVLGEKYQQIYRFFKISQERGKAFLYNLLELIRNRKDKINFARYVYVLSRLEPDESADSGQKEAYREFSTKMYQWIGNETDCRQLKTAIQLYVYLRRDKEGMESAE